jgi:hypothetical protein
LALAAVLVVGAAGGVLAVSRHDQAKGQAPSSHANGDSQGKNASASSAKAGVPTRFTLSGTMTSVVPAFHGAPGGTYPDPGVLMEFDCSPDVCRVASPTQTAYEPKQAALRSTGTGTGTWLASQTDTFTDRSGGPSLTVHTSFELHLVGDVARYVIRATGAFVRTSHGFSERSPYTSTLQGPIKRG